MTLRVVLPCPCGLVSGAYAVGFLTDGRVVAFGDACEGCGADPGGTLADENAAAVLEWLAQSSASGRPGAS